MQGEHVDLTVVVLVAVASLDESVLTGPTGPMYGFVVGAAYYGRSVAKHLELRC